MGLDTTHNCWHGAYSRFSRWRNAVAKAAGYHICVVREGEHGPHRDTIMIDWGHLPDKALHGDWPALPSDPLMILIAHSDCDGWIRAPHCEPLAARLEALLPKIEAEDFKEHTQQFIDGLREAAKAKEDVEFW